MTGWYEATAYKSEFCSEMRALYAGPLVYVDVDAFVHANYEPYFQSLAAKQYDFGAHWFQGPAGGYDKTRNDDRMLSGTLFFGDTAGARQLLAAWCEINAAMKRSGCRQGGGQKNLWFTTTCFPLKIAKLPGRYCYVFDKPWAYPKDEPRIIEHLIASRIHRDSIKKTPDVISSASQAKLSRSRQLDAQLLPQAKKRKP